MSTTAPVRPPDGFLARRRTGVQRWLRGPNRLEVAFFGALALLCGGLVFVWPHTWPIGLMMFPLVMASQWMNPRPLSWYVIACLALTVIASFGQPLLGIDTALSVFLVFLLGFVVLLGSFRRMRVGVGGVRGESMFLDLRDRLLRQHRLPQVPEGWTMQYALRSAEGTPYAGDFSIGARQGNRLQVAIVDVSGKGNVAGTRALFLSGAMSGLMGALPPARFLSEANDYLCRQDWEEGFATSVHASVDLDTGAYEVRSAGHPPAVHLRAGSGRWTMCQSEPGPALGLIDGAEYTAHRGVLERGDLIMLYTDGLVESSGLLLERGLDRLMGAAERELLHGDEDGATRLVRRLGSRNDDCALLMLRRA